MRHTTTLLALSLALVLATYPASAQAPTAGAVPAPTVTVAPRPGPPYSAALVTASYVINAPKAGVPGYMVATVRNANTVDTPLYEEFTSPVVSSGSPPTIDPTPAKGTAYGTQTRTALNVKFTLPIDDKYVAVVPDDAGLRGLTFSRAGVSPQTVTVVVNVLAAQEMKTIVFPLVVASDPIAIAEKSADARRLTAIEEAATGNDAAVIAAQAAMQQQFVQAQLAANQSVASPSPLPPPQPATPASMAGGGSSAP